MSTEENKAIYRRYIDDGFNQGKLATVDELLAPSYVDHNAAPGTPTNAEGVKQVITMFRAAFPDLKITFEAQLAEGDLVASRFTFRGTQRGPLFGIAATNRAVTMKGLSIVRIENGQVTDTWIQNDVMGLMQQLGATPPAGGA